MLIDFGDAKLQKTTHTIVHYYSSQPIIEELNDLNKQYDRLQTINTNSSEMKNYDKIIDHLKQVILNKLKTTNFTFSQVRNKRLIFPQIGSIMKAVIGNLDEKDGERYDKILNDIETNGKRLQQQSELQYTFSTEAVKIFE